MKKYSKIKRKRRRRKIMQLLIVLLALIILLIVLVREEIMGTVNNDSENYNSSQHSQVTGTEDSNNNDDNNNNVNNNEVSNEIKVDRWNYKSKYEYDVPKIRNNVEIQNKLQEFSNKYPEFTDVYNNINSYPEELLAALCNNPDMIDFVNGYLSADGSDSEGFAGDDISDDEIPLFIQWDSRWGYVSYGDDNIALSGCAPTCLAMVIVGITGNDKVTPDTVAEFATENNYYLKGTGTKWTIMTEGCLQFGVKGRTVGLSKTRVFAELEKGHPIICSMGPGDFTTLGHFIVLAGVRDGKIIVNDPNSRVRSSKLWDYEDLSGQIKNLWSFT